MGFGSTASGLAFDEIGPQRVFHYYDAGTALRAVLVIDTLRFGVSAGGVRMAADLTLEEMLRLARAMSYKFAMLDLPCGGAKAGIWLDPSDRRRADVMRAFLQAIRPLMESRTYIAGADMGTSAQDFTNLHPDAAHGAVSLGHQEFEGMALEDQLTGCGVVVAARAAAEWLGFSLRGARVALEGFGKVGAGVAKFLHREQARLVAVSTVHGTLHDAQGIDVERLLQLRGRYGDGALAEYDPGKPLAPVASLLTLPVDILIPGARPDVIHDRNVDAVRARLVVPGANIPYADGCTARLHDSGTVALPDFVSNAGGVLAGLAELQGGTAEEAFAMVRDQVARNVLLTLETARQSRCAAYEAGVGIARQRLRTDP
jgi:glutamate dehydrogenase/leucine dehydrogenase